MAKYALVIANNRYTDPGLAQLSAPGQDAEDFARILRSKEIGAFDDVKILLNQPEAVVSEAIDGFFTQKKSDDLLVLYFSGHGVRDEQGALYLAVTNTNRSRLRSTGIKSDFIREAMDQSRSRRQVLILDCCNSGAFAQGTKAALGGTIGTSSAFEGTGYGRVVLTATDSTQFAWEGDKVIGAAQTANSLFTHFLVTGLEGEADEDGDGKITVDELYDYAYGQIVSRTPWQTPGKWSYKQQGEIILRQSLREEIRPAALPADLVTALESTYPSFREAAVRQLDELMKGKNLALGISARAALEQVAASDDSRRVAQLASQVLEPYHQAERKTAEQTAQAAADNASPAGPAVEEVKPALAEALAPPMEADFTPADLQTERAPNLVRRQEITPTVSRTGWVSALWIALAWSICFSITSFVSDAVNADLGSGFITGDWIGALLGGTLVGLSTALILRKTDAVKNWKRLAIVPLGFVIGLGILFIIGNTIGYGGEITDPFMKGYTLGGTAGGALAGLGLGLYLLMDQMVSDWKGVAWICVSHAIGLALACIVLVMLYEPLAYMLSSLQSSAARGAAGGLLGGFIIGIGTTYWLRIQAQ